MLERLMSGCLPSFSLFYVNVYNLSLHLNLSTREEVYGQPTAYVELRASALIMYARGMCEWKRHIFLENVDEA